MNVNDTRRSRLKDLEKQYGGLTALATAADYGSPSTLSQIKNGTRNMGNTVARALENGLGLPDGWMDRSITNGETLAAPPPELAYFRKLSRQQREAILVILEAMTRSSRG